MRKVLVTGGGGFIGSHICVSLLNKGYEVVIVDSFINSSIKIFNKVIEICRLNNIFVANRLFIHSGDLRDKNFIKKIFEKEKSSGLPIDSVIHLAGLKSVSQSFINPYSYWDINVRGSLNLIEVMSENSCNFLVFSSSAMVYDSKNPNKLSENDNLRPTNPYSNTKLVVEKMLKDIHQGSRKLSVANLRYFNPIGAHSTGLIGENSLGNTTNLFPILLEVASKKTKKLKIYGDDWSTYDGTCIRDYVHIEDLAESHLVCLNYLFKNKSQFINFNIGTGKGTTVMELIKTFERVNKVILPFEIYPRRLGDVPKLVADNSYTKKILNWSPKKNLEKMCEDGWRWKTLNPRGIN